MGSEFTQAMQQMAEAVQHAASAMGSIEWSAISAPALYPRWPHLLTALGTASTAHWRYRPRQTMGARKMRRYARSIPRA